MHFLCIYALTDLTCGYNGRLQESKNLLPSPPEVACIAPLLIWREEELLALDIKDLGV